MKYVLILHEGEFGKAVADLLAPQFLASHCDKLTDAVVDLGPRLRGIDAVAVALWRRYPSALALLDSALWGASVPWSSAVLEGTTLLCGPVVSPPEGPCYTCFRRRLATHELRPERQQVLDEAFDASPVLGVAGHLPGTALVASVLLKADLSDHGARLGYTRYYDVVRGSIEESRTMGVHNCPCCDISAAPGQRYVNKLVNEFERTQRHD